MFSVFFCEQGLVLWSHIKNKILNHLFVLKIHFFILSDIPIFMTGTIFP